jgi:dihydroflavonol-4-reductase
VILVTGATGHLGNVLVRELLAQGEKVRAFVLPQENLAPLAGLTLEVTTGNILDRHALQAAMQDVDLVYHLAGVISILPGENPILEKVNVEGTRNVLATARETGKTRVIYTSSIHAFERVKSGILIDETIPFDPKGAISSYDRSKAQASLAVLNSVQQGQDAVIVCPTGVIGPYDYRHSEMGRLILDALDNKPQLWVEGAYDFVDVRDVANGHILAGQKGRSGETYILSGERWQVRTLIQAIQRLTGLHAPSLKVPLPLARLVSRFSPIFYRVFHSHPRFTPYSLATLASNSMISSAKARRELGYSARSLQESVADAVDWFLAERKQLSI